MKISTKLEDNIEEDGNFWVWKYRVVLILEEHDLEDHVNGVVVDWEGDEEKNNHKNNLVKAKRTIANSIKDQLIQHVSSMKNPKEMLDALTNLYKGKNINRKMTLRAQFKGVKM